MSKIPTVLRVIGWIAFGLTMVMVFLSIAGAAFLKNSSGNLISSLSVLSVVSICGLVFITFGSHFGATFISWRLKKTAASRGKKVTARILKTTQVGSVSSGRNSNSRWDIIRFDLEVDYEGETVTASTEVKASNFDASKYPPGTKVSAVYDHSTKAIAMLNKNNYVVEYF
jgi:hypothetical protein